MACPGKIKTSPGTLNCPDLSQLSRVCPAFAIYHTIKLFHIALQFILTVFCFVKNDHFINFLVLQIQVAFETKATLLQL